MRKLRSFLSFPGFEKWKPILEQVLFSLAAALLLFLPAFNKTLLNRGETVMVLNRIEAMADAMQNHMPVHAPMSGMNFSYGYGSTLFESSLPYYVPAMLRRYGADLQISFLICIFMIFACMVYASYGMARTVLRKGRIAIWITSLLASGSLCAYIMIFCDGDIADGAALCFVPMVIRSWYEMITSKGKGWVRLLYGTAMCFLCSAAYAIFLLILTLVFFLFHARYLYYHRLVLGYLCFSMVVFGLLTMWVWLPQLVLLSKGDFVLNHVYTLKFSGAGLQDLLDVIPYSSDHLGKTVGLVLLILPAFLFRCKGRTRWKFARYSVILGYAALFMTTSMFPWSLVPFAPLLRDPSRLMPVASVLLSVGAGYVIAYYPFDPKDRPFIRRCIAGVSAVILLMMVNTRYFYIGEITRDYTVKQFSDDALMIGNTDSFENRSETGDGWYLPETEFNYRNKKREVTKDGKVLSYVETDGTLVTNAAGKGVYLFPKTWYPGHAVTVREGGKKNEVIETEQDEATGLVRAKAEKDLSENASIELSYEKPAVLRITETLSILFWIAFGLSLIMVRGLRTASKLNSGKKKKAKAEQHTD